MNSRERFLRTLRGEEVDRPPVWFMRQAGRYLPGYSDLRRSHSLEELLSNPDWASRITLEPIERFDVDAAIVFSDLLLPLKRLGRRVSYDPVPLVEPTLEDPSEVESLEILPQREDPTLETIRRVRELLPHKAILGFAGGPLTLSFYLIEGRGGSESLEARRFLWKYPKEFAALLEKLSDLSFETLLAQARAGADAVQIFDTHSELLSPDAYARWVLPATQRLIDRLSSERVPVLYFARGRSFLPWASALRVDAFSLDWRVPLTEARSIVGDRPALQGNLDPSALLAGPQVARSEARRVLKEGEEAGKHILNTGHGVLPQTPLESIEAVVEEVRRWKT